MFENVAKIAHDERCNVLALSPETKTTELPTVIHFCTAANDFKLRIFQGNLTDINIGKLLSGHEDYVNDVSYDPESTFLASTGDDHTARIWTTEDYKCVGTLYLSSPGTAVCWHREDKDKLMVAEKNGIIRFYNVTSLKAILCLDYGKPLFSAHWAPFNSNLVVSLQLGELCLWDLTRPSHPPTKTNLLFTEKGGFLRFSPLGELVAAVNSLEGTFKVVDANSQQPRLLVKVNQPTNVAWHFRYPLVCLGDDTKLYFWRAVV